MYNSREKNICSVNSGMSVFSGSERKLWTEADWMQQTELSEVITAQWECFRGIKKYPNSNPDNEERLKFHTYSDII